MWVQLVLKAKRDPLAQRVILVTQVLLVVLALRALKAKRDPQVQKEIRVMWVQLVHKGQKVTQEHKAHKA